jgi:hypothetical protein
MINELEHLRASTNLFDLLTHYATLARPDRHVWHDRKMQIEGHDPREVTRLHGELIAFGWLEMNLEVPGDLRPDEVVSCYRITSAGLRALKQSQAEEDD